MKIDIEDDDVDMEEPQQSGVTQPQQSYSDIVKRQENNEGVFTRVDFPFVNRKEEIITTIFWFITTLWLQLIDPTSWTGKKTIFSDQIWGSGKTWFGLNLISQASKYETEISQRLAKYGEAKSDEKFTEWYPKILKRILKCKTGSFNCEEPITYTIERITRLLTENPSVDYFIHVDELPSKEEAVRAIWGRLNSMQTDDIKYKGRIIVFYLSGKNTLLNKIGHEHLNSPTEVLWLLLPAFKVEHVKEIYMEYFKKHLQLNYSQQELEGIFCEKLTVYTAGIPRLLEYVYCLLKIVNDEKKGIFLDSKETIDSLLSEICEFISRKALDISNAGFRETDPEVRLAALILYSSSVFGVTFNVGETLPGTKHPLRVLLGRIPYWVTGTSDRCQIVHPKVKELYLEQFENIPPFRILSGIKDQSLKETLDIAELYEFLCASLIFHHCKLLKGKTFSEFPGKIFNETILSSEVIQEIPVNNISVIEKVVENYKKSDKSKATKIMMVSEFTELINKKVSVFPSVIGVAKQSHSCDLYLLPSQGSNTGWQVKSGIQELYFGAELQKEIDKFGHDVSSGKQSLMILMSMEIDKRIKNLISPNKTCLVLTEGVYQYRSHPKKAQDGTYYDAADGYLVKFEKVSNEKLVPKEILIKGGIKKNITLRPSHSTRNSVTSYFQYDEQNYFIENESNDEKLSYILQCDPRNAGSQNTEEKPQWTGVRIPKNFTLIMMGEEALKGFIDERNLKDLRSLVNQQGHREKNYPVAVEKLSSFIYTPAMDVEMKPSQQLTNEKWITIKKFSLEKKKGGIRIQLPNDMSTLLEKGGEALGLRAVKVRDSEEWSEIVDVKSINDRDVIYLTTLADEQKHFVDTISDSE